MTARLVSNSNKNSSSGSNRSTNSKALHHHQDLVSGVGKKCGAAKNSSAASTAAVSGSNLAGAAAAIAGATGARPSDGRRANKPLMEKRRRARINQSLAVLKTLILDSARLENTKHSKLEKADILELTVRHLQRQRALGSAVLNKYRAGFQECTREVSRFLESSDLALTPGAPTPALDPTIKQRLLRHLDTCVAELDLDFGLAASPESNKDAALVKAEADSEARPDSSTTMGGDENNNSHNHGAISRPASSLGGKMTPQSSGTVGHAPGSPSPEPDPDMETVTTVATTSSPASANSGNSNNMLSVVQVIPSRLPDGQVVFLLPSHYVQLAAAAAASESGSPTTSTTATLWATTNGTNLIATSSDNGVRAAKICIPSGAYNQSIVAIEDSIDSDSLSDQPIDFTVAKRKSEEDYVDEENSGMEERGLLEGEVKEEGPVWRPW
ncbi:transcription factor HES-1-like isoform X2 [Periplaneta americana]|uniref:transcription factor HES-1-like isoform X2 n=1 Tax=Periplaneta americana TaxID=6978 RepID=UPI0037E92188